jgi:hypothetical protein
MMGDCQHMMHLFPFAEKTSLCSCWVLGLAVWASTSPQLIRWVSSCAWQMM